MNKTQIWLSVALLGAIVIGSLIMQMLKPSATVELSQKGQTDRETKHGEVKTYNTSGKLKSIVTYDNGIKDGVSYLYHEDGETVLLAMPYKKGKREGVSVKNYENGTLYASTPYKDDKLHGVRKLYYSSGQPKAEINYGYGHPGIGSKEYLLDGAEKPGNDILAEKQGAMIWLSTALPCKRADFFIGRLIEDQYFNQLDEQIKRLKTKEGRFNIDTDVYTASYLQYQDVVCLCESTQGIPIVLKKRLF